ncbi:MAG: ABC transporter permease [Candidatus Electryonea clarkiae]|nr:ABC transporter permease [Candidatus Electryonea clarkiae]MDP8286764.1 ABC transporter permease [Candidatus Electryonea clarkiae]
MYKTFIIARMEYLSTLKSKSFVIIMLMAPIIMSGSGLTMKLLENKVDTTDKKIAVIDRSGVIIEHLVEAAKTRNESEMFDEESGKKIKPAYIFESVEPAENQQSQQLELSDQVRNGSLHGFLDIGSDVLHPGENQETRRITYHSKNSSIDQVRYWLQSRINIQLRRLRLAEVEVEESVIDDVLTWLDTEALGLTSIDEETGDIKDAQRSSEIQSILIPVIFGMIMYLLILMGSISQLQSVMEEKSQRIAEVLLGSVKPFELMMGKLGGGVGIAMTVSLFYVILAVIAVNYWGYEEFIPYAVLPWFFVFTFFAIVMFGAINAALGATCNDPKDAQSMTFPALLPVIIPLFVMIPVIQQPLTGFATGMSLFPLFTPMLMTMRVATPTGIPMWQPWVGLAGVIIFALFFIWVGGRIFRVGILMQGQPPKLSNLIRWAIKG